MGSNGPTQAVSASRYSVSRNGVYSPIRVLSTRASVRDRMRGGPPSVTETCGTHASAAITRTPNRGRRPNSRGGRSETTATGPS
jgi:hypothetical protein